jgi:hypothetical protein
MSSREAAASIKDRYQQVKNQAYLSEAFSICAISSSLPGGVP